MSDLIERQAILKHIEKIRQDALMMDDTHRADIIMLGMRLCEKAVRNQPSVEPEQNWIPCSERLPEKIGTYMTTLNYGMHGHAVGQRYYHGALGWEDDCVVAWMPLPKPWKGEENG